MNTREAFEDWYEVDCYPCEHSNWFRRDSDGDYEFDAGGKPLSETKSD